MNNGKICISICSESREELIRQIRIAEELADLIEVRFDCLQTDQIDDVLNNFPASRKPYLFTYRPAEQGGKRSLTLVERISFWSRALWKLRNFNHYVDHEFDLEVPLKLDPKRAIISLHCFQRTPPDLIEKYETLTNLTGKTLKIAVSTSDVTDAIPVWKVLTRARSENNKIIPIAMGESGKWTRILGLAHGAFMTYASLEEVRETAPGQITARDLLNVYRVRELDEHTEIYGLIAGDTSYSFSPYLHNEAFKTRRWNSVFVPLQVTNLGAFMRRMVLPKTREVKLNFKGFSVTNPHKQSIIEYLDTVDDTASKIGAVNTVKIEDGKLLGYNTDAAGFISPLKKAYGDLTNAKVACFGSGGAARACDYALQQEGADVTVFARDLSKAQPLADEFGVQAEQLPAAHRPLPTDFDIIVNATPLGTRGDLEDETILFADQLAGVKLVYDLVYNPSETLLIREAKKAGAATLGGLEMFIEQGAKQFEIWTGESAPADAMKQAVEDRLVQHQRSPS